MQSFDGRVPPEAANFRNAPHEIVHAVQKFNLAGA